MNLQASGRSDQAREQTSEQGANGEAHDGLTRGGLPAVIEANGDDRRGMRRNGAPGKMVRITVRYFDDALHARLEGTGTKIERLSQANCQQSVADVGHGADVLAWNPDVAARPRIDHLHFRA